MCCAVFGTLVSSASMISCNARIVANVHPRVPLYPLVNYCLFELNSLILNALVLNTLGLNTLARHALVRNAFDTKYTDTKCTVTKCTASRPTRGPAGAALPPMLALRRGRIGAGDASRGLRVQTPHCLDPRSCPRVLVFLSQQRTCAVARRKPHGGSVQVQKYAVDTKNDTRQMPHTRNTIHPQHTHKTPRLFALLLS
jgi:hypothetical protein